MKAAKKPVAKKPVAKKTKATKAKKPSTRTAGIVAMHLEDGWSVKDLDLPDPFENVRGLLTEAGSKDLGPRSLLVIGLDIEDLAYELLGPRDTIYSLTEASHGYNNEVAANIGGMLEREISRIHDRLTQLSKEIRKHHLF